MATISIGAFDCKIPQRFYLLGIQEDMEALSDATLVVEGQRLPVHSSTLSQASAVLRGLFVACLGSSDPRAGSKCKASGAEGGQGAGELVLAEPFKDCTLFDAALFLRFVYNPHDLTAVNLAAVQGSVPGLMRLVHKLDAQLIQKNVLTHLAEGASSATTADLLAWIEAADGCQLPAVSMGFIRELACRLANEPISLTGAFADAAALLQQCEPSIQARLLGLMARAGGPDLARNLAPPVTAAKAWEQAANLKACRLEWALERFSEQPTAVDEPVCSPWFTAAGWEWRLEVYPGGETAVGHLSLYLVSKGEVNAIVSLTVVDQVADSPDHVQRGDSKAHLCSSRGYPRFMTLERLRSRPGYLAGDRLVLRARVEMVP